MNARYSNAYAASIFLHGAAVAAVLLLAYLANQSVVEHPKVFELVAGEGDNYAATEAPALGEPNAIKAELPAPLPPAPTPPAPVQAAPPIEAPAPQPEPPTAKLEPVRQPAHHPSTVKIKPVPAKPITTASGKAAPVRSMKSALRHSIDHTAWKLEAKYRRELEAEKRRQESYDKYLREHGLASTPSKGIHGGVAGGSPANTTGGAHGHVLTREESSLLDSYFAFLLARAKENFVAPPDVNDKLVAKISFFLAADGTISRVHILSSSGNAEFDRAAVDAFRHTHSIGPRPDGHSEEVTSAFSLREEE